MDIEEHRPRGIARVGDVQSAVGQLPDEPAIDGPECQLAGFGLAASTRHVIENPRELAAGEVRVDDEAGPVADQRPRARRPASRSQNGAVRRSCQTIALQIGVPVLPIPDDGGFPLVGDADGGHVLRAETRPMDCLNGDADLSGPDFQWIVLDPARLGIVLREFLLGDGPNRAIVVEDNGACAGGSGIECQDGLHDCRAGVK